jgi:membrane protease YdiL (CAAX protease family)
MLTAKPWKADAIMRLGISVLICAFIGTLLMNVEHYVSGGKAVNPKLFYPLAAGALLCLIATVVLIGRPWQLETSIQPLAALMICASAGLLLGLATEFLAGGKGTDVSIWRMSIGAVSIQGAALVLLPRFLREHQTTWAEGFGLRNRGGQSILLGLLAGLFFVMAAWGLERISALIMTHLPFLELEPQEQIPIRALRLSLSWQGRLVFGLTAVLLAPLAEEMAFRGILYPKIKQAGYPRLALWGSALLFATIHFNLVTFLPLMALALLLTGLYEWTNNLLAPIAAHMLFNTLNLVELLRQTGGL